MSAQSPIPTYSSSRKLRNSTDYVHGVIAMLEQNAALDVFCMHQVFPYALYPSRTTDFIRVRKNEAELRATLMGVTDLVSQYHKAFTQAYKKGITFRYVMGISSLDYYRTVMHATFHDQCATELGRIQRAMEAMDVHIHVIENAPAYCMFLGANECLFAVINATDPGAVTTDPHAIAVHKKLFDQQYALGKPLAAWWQKLISNKRCTFSTRPTVGATANVPAKHRNDPTATPMKPSPQARVFISHSSKDKPFVRKLVEQLKSQQLNVWLDEQEIKVGDSITSKISGGLKDSDYLVAVLSKASVASPWVQAELNSALMDQISNKGTAVLPVLIEDCDIPTLLRDRLYADFRGDFKSGLAKLLAVLKQEGETAADLGATTTTTTTTTLPPGAVPCVPTLAALSLGELRRRITKRMDRSEVAAIWFDLFQSKMDDDMGNRPLVDCVIELLDRANKRAKLDEVIAGICSDRNDIANP